MDSEARYSQVVSDKLKKEAALLRGKFLENEHLSEEEVRQAIGWLEGIQEAPFGSHLLLNRRLNGSWPIYRQGASHPLDKLLFHEMPALVSMQQRFEVQQDVLFKIAFKGIHVGVFPGSYAGEWSFLEYEAEASISGVDEAASLMASESRFDVLLWNTFLYGDGRYDDDPYAYLFAGLRPGGVLLMSFWTAPEDPLNPQLRTQRLFFETMLGMSKSEYQSTSKVKSRLRQAGFDQIQIICDAGGQLRCIIAKKPFPAATPLKTKRTTAHAPRRMSRKGICFRIFTPSLAQ